MISFRTKVLPEAFYRGLDRGIRFPVRVLHAHGFDTCQSCQGGKGHPYDQPTIDAIWSPVDGWKLLEPTLEQTW